MGMPRFNLSLLPMNSSVDSEGRVSIGGVDLLSIVEEYGTPIFVYDEEHLRTSFREAVELFGSGTAYATKAFHCRRVARLAHDTGLSLDVSTAGEYHVARSAGFPAEKLVVHGNNKTRAEVTQAVSDGVQWLVLDSFDDIALVGDVAESLRKTVRVLVRINPGVEVHTHRYIATGNRGSKFGFPMWTDDAAKAVDVVRQTRYFDFAGLHIHVGSQVFSLETFDAALKSVLGFVRSIDPEYFVVGGGLGARYLPEDDAPSLREWAASIHSRITADGVRAKVLAEPGRSLVASAAVTLYTVGSVATKDQMTFVAVDGGMSDNPRPIIYDSGYEVFMPGAAHDERSLITSVVGRHCESGDTLVPSGSLPAKVQVGDVICTPVTGAYGYVMASNYNMMLRPPVVFVSNGVAELSIKGETLDDLIRRDLG